MAFLVQVCCFRGKTSHVLKITLYLSFPRNRHDKEIEFSLPHSKHVEIALSIAFECYNPLHTWHWLTSASPKISSRVMILKRTDTMKKSPTSPSLQSAITSVYWHYFDLRFLRVLGAVITGYGSKEEKNWKSQRPPQFYRNSVCKSNQISSEKWKAFIRVRMSHIPADNEWI